MLDLENEYYIRLILLMIRGGTLVLRQILIKKLADKSTQLDTFLQINKVAVKKLKDEKVLTLKQYNILFPHDDTMPDIRKLDISLLSCLLLNLFGLSVQKIEMNAIENIRTLRNDFTAHHPNGCIDGRTFNNKWNQLSTSIMNLGKGLSDEQSSTLAEIIKCVGKDPIDINWAIQYIKDENGTMDQFLEHVSKQLEQFSLEVQDIRTAIKQLERIVSQNGNTGISTVIVGEVTVSGRNPEAVTEAAATLLAHAKRSKGFVEKFSSALEFSRQGITNIMSAAFTRVKGFFSSQNLALTQDEQSASERCVTSLVQDIQDAGGEVIDVTEGSVLLHIRCHSVVVLLSVLNYFKSTVLEQKLKDIEECLTEETGSKINLSACIQIKSLQEACQNIHEKQSNMSTRRVRFSIKCRDAEGVLNVVNLFEGSKMSDNISVLSDSLSSEVEGPVTLRTSVDSHAVPKYIKDIKEARDEQIMTRPISEKKAWASESVDFDLGVETDQQYVLKDLSTPAESELSLLSEQSPFRSLHEQSFKDGIMLLQKTQYEFAAFVLYNDKDENVSRFVVDKLNTKLQLLTGIKRDLICFKTYSVHCDYTFNLYIEHSAIVVVIVSDEIALNLEHQIRKPMVPIIIEGRDVQTSNLHDVRFLLKKEFDETEWTKFCTSIIRLIPTSARIDSLVRLKKFSKE